MNLLSSLKQRLLGGAISYGPLLMSDSPVVAELLASVGYGHVVVDHEHSPTDVRSGQCLLQAIQSAHHSGVSEIRTEPIVRVPAPDDPAYMKKVLDSMTLPGGVLVPMVDDAATAVAVVRSTRYPRQHYYDDVDGIRGCAAPFVRGSLYGARSNEDYLRQCRDDLLVMVQVESPRGVANLPEIAAVPGVDAVFLGPFDLSAAVGKMGQLDDPDVVELLAVAEEAARQCRDHCLLAGFQSPHRSLEDMVEAGYSLICGAVDLGLLRDGAPRDLAAARKAISTTAATASASAPADE